MSAHSNLSASRAFSETSEMSSLVAHRTLFAAVAIGLTVSHVSNIVDRNGMSRFGPVRGAQLQGKPSGFQNHATLVTGQISHILFGLSNGVDRRGRAAQPPGRRTLSRPSQLIFTI